MKKKLIVIEGLDGSGKATQTALLAEKLISAGMKIRRISFPDYASDSSALVKMYLNGEFGTHADDVNAYAASSFYAVDRYASFMKDWKPDYEAGVIIADRYTTSNAIHQCAKLPKEQWDKYLDWLFDYEYRMLGIPKPDSVIYLKVDPEISQELLSGRYQGHEEKKDIHEKDIAYLKRCQEAAGYCAEKLGWQIVECCEHQAMRSVDAISSDIFNLISAQTQDTGTSVFELSNMVFEVVKIRTVLQNSDEPTGLSFFEGYHDIPFPINRLYMIYENAQNKQNGFHAQKQSWHLFFCPFGSIRIIVDDGKTKREVLLDSPSKGLLLHPGIWRDIVWNTAGSVLCVAASGHYDPDKLRTNYADYLHFLQEKINSDRLESDHIMGGDML